MLIFSTTTSVRTCLCHRRKISILHYLLPYGSRIQELCVKTVVNYKMQRPKKPCFVCGNGEHGTQECTETDTFSQLSGMCLQSGDYGYNMFSCFARRYVFLLSISVCYGSWGTWKSLICIFGGNLRTYKMVDQNGVPFLSEQLVRSNIHIFSHLCHHKLTKKCIDCHHTYRKHLTNIILSLLTDLTEGHVNDDEAMVLMYEKFEHLGFLIQVCDKGSEGIPLGQAAPCFAISDPEMAAVPVPAARVYEWVMQIYLSSIDTSPANATDQVVSMVQNSEYPSKGSNGAKHISFVEAISKTSGSNQPSDYSDPKGSSIKVLNCHDSVIYILAPLQYATLYRCFHAINVLKKIGKDVRVEHRDRVHVISSTKQICVTNHCECVFFLVVHQRPVFLGDNHKLQVAPYNTFYPQLGMQMTKVGIDANFIKWVGYLVLRMVDTHESLSHFAGVSNAQDECLDPDHYTVIPNWFHDDPHEATKHNPFSLAEVYYFDFSILDINEILVWR
ncbi:hypothetical protein MKW94_028303, partial [Papaver nudicaule]|nr:hypothetical protein [Papaver nudicaule]